MDSTWPMNRMRLLSLALGALTVHQSVFLTGCRRDDLPRKIVFGSVTCGDEKVASGHLRFVPIENSPGPCSIAAIVDGQYRIELQGGVPVGKHRVEIDARRKTGRKVAGVTPDVLVEESIRLGPDACAGPRSPIVVEVRGDSDGRINLAIPKLTEKEL